ncbi:hypothetical protein [Streptomyces eurythermus]
MAERTRDERIETYYHQSARDLAERVVDLEDEAATLNAECDRARNAWRSARRRASRAMSSWRYMRWREDAQSKEMRKQDEYARWLWDLMSSRRQERDRYRLAWLSARRRAADEANFGLEALALRDAEIERLRAELEQQRQTFDARLALVGDDEDGGIWVSDIVGKKIRRHPNI